MPDIDLELLSATALQATDLMTVRRGAGPTYSMALVAPVTAPVATRIYRATNQSIPTGAGYTSLSWSAAAYEANGDFWTSGATITIPETGYYQIFAEATFDGTGLLGAATCNMQILLNGATVIGDDEKQVMVNGKAPMWVMAQRLFTAGDTLVVQVKHSDAGAVNILAQGDHSPDIILAKIGGAKGDPGTGFDGDFITMPTALAAPAASDPATIRVFGRTVAGRAMLGSTGPSGLDTLYQPHIGRNAVTSWLPSGNSVTVTTLRASAFKATGAATASTVAVTNRHTRMKRIDYLVTTAAATAVAGFLSADRVFSIGAATSGDGGFHFIGRWGPATGVATVTHRAFFGLSNNAGVPTDVDPSSLINSVGMGYDTADANVQVIIRGAGAAVKIDLGASFPKPTADRTAVYELAMFAPPGTPQVLNWQVTDIVSGATATGQATTGLPVDSMLLAPRGYVSVGGTSSVVGLAFMGLTIETDY